MIDIRHPLSEFDYDLIEWCRYHRRPLHLLLTKADKLSYGAAKNTLLEVQKALAEFSWVLSCQLFSATRRIGIDQAHAVLDHWFEVAE